VFFGSSSQQKACFQLAVLLIRQHERTAWNADKRKYVPYLLVCVIFFFFLFLFFVFCFCFFFFLVFDFFDLLVSPRGEEINDIIVDGTSTNSRWCALYGYRCETVGRSCIHSGRPPESGSP
jgi:hypothetical protein